MKKKRSIRDWLLLIFGNFWLIIIPLLLVGFFAFSCGYAIFMQFTIVTFWTWFASISVGILVLLIALAIIRVFG